MRPAKKLRRMFELRIVGEREHGFKVMARRDRVVQEVRAALPACALCLWFMITLFVCLGSSPAPPARRPAVRCTW
jgi:hypothetical protein